ncbi:methyl-accepting chemotaxis protein [Leptolyngbya sp. FACHB-16]|nr:methyl-accepting chemotaxis protein [Leptolyngbya sp. FACHB-8]MBD2157599.1 methyl-accepting chemotaxis protein [Leptolyngbya sp. FACHB-16]
MSSIAVNPLIYGTARVASTQVDAQRLTRVPASQLEYRFRATRTLQSGTALSQYLQVLERQDSLSKVFFTNRQGMSVAASRLPKAFYNADQGWWQQTKQKGVYITSPVTDGTALVTEGMEISMILTDPSTNGFVGVLSGIVEADVFDQSLTARNQQLHETLGQKGDPILQFLSDKNEVFRTIDKTGVITQTGIIGGNTVLGKVNAFRQTLANSAKSSEIILSEPFVTDGREVQLSSIPGTDWIMVLSVDEEALSTAARQLSLIFISLVPILAAIAVAAVIVLARRLSQPLGELAYTASQVAEGDLDIQAQVQGTIESQTLAQTFNNLVVRVKELLRSQEEAAREQLNAQMEAARQQTEYARQQQEAKEFLQNRALELLMEVSPLREGDLTIRANVTEDEIGTIADSYNATISSLKRIVAQVQSVAVRVAHAAEENQDSLTELTGDAQQQANSVQQALNRIEEMSRSIQMVAQGAQEAQQAVRIANETVIQGDAAMNRTVEGIMAIRETVAETAKKVKQLGESSQKISKVVNLIGTFAAQTNLLALNASIEAARAGEEGRGFAVVADEVRSLARQSAKATAEIEQLVASIQTETNEVVSAMEEGTQQVVTGTQLVEETRQSLNQIAKASEQISQLVQTITEAAIAQSENSALVSETITSVAGLANNTSVRASTLLETFQDLLSVAQDLQTTVSQFKLN